MRTTFRKTGLYMAAILCAAGTANAQNSPWVGTPIGSPVSTGTVTPCCGARLQVHGDEVITHPGTSDMIDFNLPNSENGFSFLQGAGQRADIRFNGSILQLLAATTSGTAPAATNGIAIKTDGKVGMGNSNPLYKLTINDPSGSAYGSWITSNSVGPTLAIRRDGSGTFTPSSAPSTACQYALSADNETGTTDGSGLNGGGLFTAFTLGVWGEVTAQVPDYDIVGVTGKAQPAGGVTMSSTSSIGLQGIASGANTSYGLKASGTGTGAGYGALAAGSSTNYGYGLMATGSGGLYGFGVTADGTGSNTAHGMFATGTATSSGSNCTGYGIETNGNATGTPGSTSIAYGVNTIATATCPTGTSAAWGVRALANADIASDSSLAIGVHGIALAKNYSVGVKGEAFAQLNSTTSPYNHVAYGVMGITNTVNCNDSSLLYGVYGIASTCPGKSHNWAGYFDGNVFAMGAFIASDEKLKENIKPIENSIDIIKQLSPKTYNFKQGDEYLGLNGDNVKQYGLIAQELERVLPELVKRTDNPEVKDHDGKLVSRAFDFKSVNYIGLIPILLDGVKTQQQQIDAKDAKIAELEQRLNGLATMMNDMKQVMDACCSQQSLNIKTETADGSYMEQNVPNPLGASTSIRYHLAAGTQTASMQFVSIEGKVLFVKDLAVNAGQVDINTSNWASGTYTYTLLVNGKAIDTKKMVIVK